MKLAAVTFSGWIVSLMIDSIPIMQWLVLFVSLLAGLVSLFKALRSKSPE